MGVRVLPRRRRAAVLLASLLLVLRFALPAASAGAAGDALQGGLDEAPICHADAGPASPAPAGKPVLPPAHDCSLCPACQPAAPALLPTAAWVPAPSSVRAAQAAPLPPSTGPPQPARYAAPPRGPPASAV